MREQLLENAESALEERGYDTLRYFAACVDLGARQERGSFVIKVLGNIDGFSEGSAGDLAKLGSCLDAEPVVLGETTKVERMQDGIIYRRHELPALTLETFEAVLDGAGRLREYSRGRELVDVDGAAMKKARGRAGLSMQSLADSLGISKESVYFYESGRMRARVEISERISRLLNADVVREQTLSSTAGMSEHAKGGIQKKLEELDFSIYRFSRFGISTGAVHSRERILLNERACGISRLERMKRFSEFFDSMFALVSERELVGIPTVTRESILSAGSKRELLRLLR